MGTPFGSDKVITQHIPKADLKTYFVGFDIDDDNQRQYRWKELIDVLQNVIPEFAFGHHEGQSFPITQSMIKIRDAANSIYKVKEFEQARGIYQSGGSILDSNPAKKYLQRGEFGELILHLLLRDFHCTVPLLSKIYFKDAYGSTPHGFDAVHVEPLAKTLWLGESKIYIDPRKGIKELIQDIKNHFKRDYLNDEFSIISKKLKPYDNIPEKDHWLQLMDEKTKLLDLFKSISIPLLCTYTSDNFTKYDDEILPDFVKDYEKEVIGLKAFFDKNNDHPLKTNLNTILLLFPVKCKNELVRRMHERLCYLQGV
jgi:uncharacterized protein YutD